MKKISKKQQVANKKNAKKGGIKTDIGKQAIKHNALKHGILSSETIIKRGDIEENFEEYEQLKESIFSELCPKGMIEIMLVDNILTTYWRLRRVIQTERAIIESQRVGHMYGRILSKAKERSDMMLYNSADFFEKSNKSYGCTVMLEKTREVLEEVRQNGLPLSDYSISILFRDLGLSENFPKTETLWLLHCMAKDKDKIGIDEKGLLELKEHAIKNIKELEAFFERRKQQLEESEAEKDEATLEAKFIPEAEDLMKIQRYEAHLQKSFYLALHELQRVQSVRLGNPMPNIASLDITLNNENGFVS